MVSTMMEALRELREDVEEIEELSSFNAIIRALDENKVVEIVSDFGAGSSDVLYIQKKNGKIHCFDDNIGETEVFDSVVGCIGDLDLDSVASITAIKGDLKDYVNESVKNIKIKKQSDYKAEYDKYGYSESWEADILDSVLSKHPEWECDASAGFDDNGYFEIFDSGKDKSVIINTNKDNIINLDVDQLETLINNRLKASDK